MVSVASWTHRCGANLPMALGERIGCSAAHRGGSKHVVRIGVVVRALRVNVQGERGQLTETSISVCVPSENSDFDIPNLRRWRPDLLSTGIDFYCHSGLSRTGTGPFLDRAAGPELST